MLQIILSDYDYLSYSSLEIAKAICKVFNIIPHQNIQSTNLSELSKDICPILIGKIEHITESDYSTDLPGIVSRYRNKDMAGVLNC